MGEGYRVFRVFFWGVVFLKVGRVEIMLFFLEKVWVVFGVGGLVSYFFFVLYEYLIELLYSGIIDVFADILVFFWYF